MRWRMPPNNCLLLLYARGFENRKMCGACYLCQVCLQDRAVLSGYTIHYNVTELCAVCENRGGRPGPNSPYGLCGRKATLNYTLLIVKIKFGCLL